MIRSRSSLLKVSNVRLFFAHSPDSLTTDFARIFEIKLRILMEYLEWLNIWFHYYNLAKLYESLLPGQVVACPGSGSRTALRAALQKLDRQFVHYASQISETVFATFQSADSKHEEYDSEIR